jgi:hypothetical protein
MIPIKPKSRAEKSTFSNMWKKVNQKLTQSSSDTAESRYMGLFLFVDMTKDFFFSYTYDLTHSMQHNYIKSNSLGKPINEVIVQSAPSNERFEWNYYQTYELKEILGTPLALEWVLPIIHGSFQQRRLAMFSKTIDLTVIARRSRHYAGTRYLKRGVNVEGKTANDCEIEQIIQVSKL